MFLVDASVSLGKGDKYVLDKIKDANKPVILVLNKIDNITKEQILFKINEYKDLYEFDDIVPVSAIKNNNVDTLISVIKKYLKDEIMYYSIEEVTNRKIDFLIAEIIREKVFNVTNEEVPHSTTCVVESIEFGKNSNTINASIIVDRDSLKKIIIGNKGSKIKEIGSLARVEIEELMGKKVYLSLFVKTIKKWQR